MLALPRSRLQEEEKWRGELETVKAKEDAKRSDIPALFKERDELRKKVNEHHDAKRKLHDKFNEEMREWKTYIRAQKDAKHKEYLEMKAKKQAEYEAQKKLWEEEVRARTWWVMA